MPANYQMRPPFSTPADRWQGLKRRGECPSRGAPVTAWTCHRQGALAGHGKQPGGRPPAASCRERQRAKTSDGALRPPRYGAFAGRPGRWNSRTIPVLECPSITQPACATTSRDTGCATRRRSLLHARLPLSTSRAPDFIDCSSRRQACLTSKSHRPQTSVPS